MNLMELIDENLTYIILGLTAITIILLIIAIILIVKNSRLTNKYNKFMHGAKGESLESTILNRFDEIDNLKENTFRIEKELDAINENLQLSIQKVGIVKYDAFMEMGGKLSFVLALLDKNNYGFILNSVHSSREGCYTYLKEIIKGESFLELSADEKKALDEAIKSNTFME